MLSLCHVMLEIEPSDFLHARQTFCKTGHILSTSCLWIHKHRHTHLIGVRTTKVLLLFEFISSLVVSDNAYFFAIKAICVQIMKLHDVFVVVFTLKDPPFILKPFAVTVKAVTYHVYIQRWERLSFSLDLFSASEKPSTPMFAVRNLDN